jgi:hypothetical protein
VPVGANAAARYPLPRTRSLKVFISFGLGLDFSIEESVDHGLASMVLREKKPALLGGLLFLSVSIISGWVELLRRADLLYKQKDKRFET